MLRPVATGWQAGQKPVNAFTVRSSPWSWGEDIAAGLWRSSARKYKEYALNPCCPACARDLVDCLSEKMFAAVEMQSRDGGGSG